MIKTDHNKIKYFGKNIYKCCELLKVKKPIIVKPDRRFEECTAEVRIVKNRKTNKREYVIVYNIEGISSLPYWKIMYVILHELGHIKTKQKGTIFNKEYHAEKFAYRAIKKHFKLQLSRYLNYITWYKTTYKDVYQRVFRKLLKEIKK